MKFSGIFIGAIVAGSALTPLAAEAGSRGVWHRTTYYDADYLGAPLSNHPYAWQYHSTYPWAQPSTYHAGPGAYYPAYGYRKRQARGNARWTGYPPRHFYVVDYNGYAPAYGYPAYMPSCYARC